MVNKKRAPHTGSRSIAKGKGFDSKVTDTFTAPSPAPKQTSGNPEVCFAFS